MNSFVRFYKGGFKSKIGKAKNKKGLLKYFQQPLAIYSADDKTTYLQA